MDILSNLSGMEMKAFNMREWEKQEKEIIETAKVVLLMLMVCT